MKTKALVIWVAFIAILSFVNFLMLVSIDMLLHRGQVDVLKAIILAPVLSLAPICLILARKMHSRNKDK